MEAGAWLILDIAESHHYGERDWTSVNLKGVYEQKVYGPCDLLKTRGIVHRKY